jgi:hypothetical protein
MGVLIISRILYIYIFFRASIVGKEVLPPPELEKVFGLTGGTIYFTYLYL